MNQGKHTILIAKKFKATMLKCSLSDYSDIYIHVKGHRTVPNTAAESSNVNNTNKKVIKKTNLHSFY